MLARLDMVAIWVKDWASAVRWYQDVLGLTVAHVEEDDRFAVLTLPAGQASVHLVGVDDIDIAANNRVMPNFFTDDFDGTIDALQKRGVTVASLIDSDEGYRLARIVDLEGNYLNIFTWS